jgi:glycosyltransferase involved in cell wall biosynthesis
MVSGCMIAATDYGALRETCGEAADFMAYTALRNHLSANFADLAAAAIDRARREPQAEAARRREHAERARRECDWNRRAEEWEAWLGELA